MMMLLKVLFLLWSINFAPPLLAHLFQEKWNTPADLGIPFVDGRSLFGSHKTIRGVLGGVAAGWLLGLLLGFPWWVGLSTGILSMAGDLISSFIKRRCGFPSGTVVPGLDQAFEGSLPFNVLAPYLFLSGATVALLVTVFSVGAFAGSCFYNRVLLTEPVENYPRRLDTRVRIRELRACQITSNPVHHLLNFEDAIYYHVFMKTVFRVLGIYETGRRNALKVEIRDVTFRFPDLPHSFEEYTILFLSDLHLDGLDGLTEKLQSIVSTMPVDLCILGGDFRMDTHGPSDEALARLSRLVPEIRARDGVLGILGNHDCVEMMEPMEKLGVRFLVNDARTIERNGERIWIVGVDDPHYFKCHDLAQAFDGVPPKDFSIFVAHSNELYKDAAAYFPQLYLCGHSHAGQIQIPPFGPIFTHSKAPRRFCKGTWHYQNMAGYTSYGVGVSGVPVRFFSQGEVLVVTLKREWPIIR